MDLDSRCLAKTKTLISFAVILTIIRNYKLNMVFKHVDGDYNTYESDVI